jgi:site-specific recombinase XerD
LKQTAILSIVPEKSSKFWNKYGITGIKVAPHKLRHSIDQYLYDRGLPLEPIQKFLGHSAIKATQIYARSSIKHVQDDMSRDFGELEDRS